MVPKNLDHDNEDDEKEDGETRKGEVDLFLGRTGS